ncbi:hypothetical protein [Streptomyces sp. 7N604]|uniref:hypothetical protein n=1 Tax=Streptomyces sp. 7N604 TaxID=3457415 RepID=UPI003FD1E26C
MKGDRVEMVVDAGDTTRTYDRVDSRAVRRVETAVRRGVVEVSEVTLPQRFAMGGAQSTPCPERRTGTAPLGDDPQA